MTTHPVELTLSAGEARTEPGPVRLAATLAIAGMLSGLALAAAYGITKPIIDANNQRALEQAVLQVVPGSTSIQKLSLRDGKLVAVSPTEGGGEATLYAAYDEQGKFKGYAIEGAGAGFQDVIRLLYGYDPAKKRVIGMYILDSRETPGLGDKIFKDAAFTGTFADLAVDPEIVVVKTGRTKNNEVDAITGATISSRAVVRIINEAHGRWVKQLPPPGAEPAHEAKGGAR